MWPEIISVLQTNYGNTKYEFKCRCTCTHYASDSVAYTLCPKHFGLAFPTDPIKLELGKSYEVR